jgi:hypothetical protein
MPQVAGQSFPYTVAGRAAAGAARKMLSKKKGRGARKKSVAMTRALMRKGA